MLRYVRAHQKRIFLFVAIAVVIPFAFWGVMEDSEGKTPTILGNLDGRQVSVSEYRKSYRAIHDQGVMTYGDEFLRMAKEEDLLTQAWDRLLFLGEAKRRGLKTADAEVVQWLTTQPVFAPAGAFDERLYQRFVREYLRNDPRQFEEQIREALTIEKLRSQVESKIELSDEELKAAYARESAERELLVLFAEPDPSKAKPVTDQDIETIYPYVKDRLTAPRRVKVSYLKAPLTDKRTAEIAADASNLEESARKFGLEVRTTEFFSENQAVADFTNAPDALFAAFEQEPGTESAWLKAEDGIYKVKALEREAERPMTMEESRGELKRILEGEAVARTALEKLEPLKEKIQSLGLEAAGKEAGLELKKVEDYKAGLPVAGIGNDPRFDREVALLKDGETSVPFLAGGRAVVVKAVKTEAPDDEALAKVSDELRKRLTREKTSAELQKLADRLRGDLVLNPEAVKKILPQGADSN